MYGQDEDLPATCNFRKKRKAEMTRHTTMTVIPPNEGTFYTVNIDSGFYVDS